MPLTSRQGIAQTDGKARENKPDAVAPENRRLVKLSKCWCVARRDRTHRPRHGQPSSPWSRPVQVVWLAQSKAQGVLLRN